MQTTGDRVGIGVELATGVQLGHDDIDGGYSGGMHRHRNTAAVVLDLDPAVFQHGHLDGGGIPGHRLIDGVVDNFPDQVVQTALAGGPDVHTGALPDRFKPL